MAGQSPINNHYFELHEPLIHVTASNGEVIQQYSPHEPIIISSNSEFASQGFAGSGTIDDPYKIEGFNITASQSALIVIRHTTAYFSIRNNILNGIFQTSQGINLFNVVHGTIENNFIFNHESIGIILDLSTYNVITNNTITNNFNGIKLGRGGYNTVTKNTICNNKLNGIMSESRGNILSENLVTGNQQGGIWLSGSDESILSANIISNNSLQGIFLTSSSTSIISNNSVINNGYAGVEISSSNQINVSSNTISNNNNEGLFLSDSSGSSVLNNTISANHGYGIHLDEITQNNTISGNYFIGNNPDGGSQARDDGQGNIFEANYWDDWTNTHSSSPIEGIGTDQDPFTLSKSDNPFILNTNIIFGVCALIVIISALVVIIRKQVLVK